MDFMDLFWAQLHVTEEQARLCDGLGIQAGDVVSIKRTQDVESGASLYCVYADWRNQGAIRLLQVEREDADHYRVSSRPLHRRPHTKVVKRDDVIFVGRVVSVTRSL